MIKKRSIALFILLSVVTLGIYPLVVYCIMGNEVNKICEGDGKKNMFYLLALLLGLVTLGIYTAVWFYKAMNRLQDNAYRYGQNVRPAYSGGQFLLWFYLGAFLLGVGPIVAVAYFISDVNQFAGVYGTVQPLPYTENQAERAMMLANGAFVDRQQQIPYEVNQSQGAALAAGAAGDVYARERAAAGVSGAAQQPAPPLFPDSSATTRANEVDSNKVTNRRQSHSGVIRGIEGMYGGFDFPIEHNEEISIGTDPSVSSIVIDINNQFISAQHCIIRFDANSDSYLVKDASDYGTFTVDGVRFPPGMPKLVSRGERIVLGDGCNIFRLG